LNAVSGPNGYWSQYLKYQTSLLSQLDAIDPTVPDASGRLMHTSTLPADQLAPRYQRAYETLWLANYNFTYLRNSWQEVVDSLSNEAGEALSSIFGVVAQQVTEVDDITNMLEQQLSTSHSVAHVMQTVMASTRQSNDSTRAAARDMERVAMLAEQLLASVGAFKLPDRDYAALQESSVSLHTQPNGNSRTMTPIPLSPPYSSRPENGSETLAFPQGGSRSMPLQAPAAWPQGQRAFPPAPMLPTQRTSEENGRGRHEANGRGRQQP
jgi:hypothetical protein